MSELTEEKTVSVAVANTPALTPTANPALNFMFMALCFVFWANGFGWLGENASITMGVIQVGVWFTYMLGSFFDFTNRDGFSGNCFMVFAEAIPCFV